jgi:hypothetical protein
MEKLSPRGAGFDDKLKCDLVAQIEGEGAKIA